MVSIENPCYEKGSVKITILEDTAEAVDLLWSRQMLKKFSQMFAFACAELPLEIQDVVSLFYLVLRALDSIEDDTSVEAGNRQKELIAFHGHLHEKGYTLKGYGANSDEVDLLENFDRINRCLSTLDSKYTEIIISISRKMGFGMEKFVSGKTIISLHDYDEYCQIASGLTGEGLARIWMSSGFEKQTCPISARLMTSRCSTIGLLFGKVNMIRDVKEDFDEGRFYWPQEVVLEYMPSFNALFQDKFEDGALKCLNYLVLNALSHVEEVLEGLIAFKNPKIFRFCAIPTVMVISTLANCYNNSEVFKKKIEMRKSEAFTTWERTKRPNDLLQLTNDHLAVILRKVVEENPSDEAMKLSVNKLINFCSEKADLSG